MRELTLFRSILRCDVPDIPGGFARRDSTSSQYRHRSPHMSDELKLRESDVALDNLK